MKKPSKKAPSRFAHSKHHALYGIWNYLSKKGIDDGKDMSDLINAFCYKEKFENPAKDIHKKQYEFIQNRFGKFVEFVREYTKPLPNLNL
jgi:hypothetical protein